MTPDQVSGRAIPSTGRVRRACPSKLSWVCANADWCGRWIRRAAATSRFSGGIERARIARAAFLATRGYLATRRGRAATHIAAAHRPETGTATAIRLNCSRIGEGVTLDSSLVTVRLQTPINTCNRAAKERLRPINDVTSQEQY